MIKVRVRVRETIMPASGLTFLCFTFLQLLQFNSCAPRDHGQTIISWCGGSSTIVTSGGELKLCGGVGLHVVMISCALNEYDRVRALRVAQGG